MSGIRHRSARSSRAHCGVDSSRRYAGSGGVGPGRTKLVSFSSTNPSVSDRSLSIVFNAIAREALLSSDDIVHSSTCAVNVAVA